MHSSELLRALLLFGFAVFSVSANSHFVIVTDLSPTDLHAILKNLNISHTSHACLNSSLHYFRSDISHGDLLHWLKHLRKLPGIFSVEYQSAIYVQKKAPEFTELQIEDRFVELESDDEYALAVKNRSAHLRRLLNFNDPNAQEVWQFLNDGSSRFGGSPGLDLNVYPVYAANITGKGVIAIVVDDALDTTHEDLRQNIRMDLTADLLNSTRKDARGTDLQMKKSNDHGTEVAGLLAAVANNSKCAFGVAYNATLGGVRLLGNKVTDFMVGEALVRFSQEANMYISSWGPSDNGRVMHSPKKYMSYALNRTAHKGNHGRGSVFLFPAGNGGEKDDNCGADGFVNNPHVMSVTAIGENGLAPAYAERCAAIAIAVPIGGAHDKVTFRNQISRRHFFVSTTDINNRCTKQFVGTSASNPMVGGVIALAMEINPNLTPRDVAAILSFSGRIPVAAATDFNINGGGMLVSHTYGSGLLNAVRMVNLAKNWNPLGRRLSCLQSRGEKWPTRRSLHQKMSKLLSKYTFEKLIFPGKATAFTFTFSQSDCPVEILELVRVEMHWAHERRGSLDVWLVSPSGQIANLLAPRHRDRFSGISHMSWKSLIHTGERCYGNWTVMVMDKQPRGRHYPFFARRPSGYVRFVSMEMLGTRTADSAFEKNKETISKHWLRIQNRTRDRNRAVYLRPETLYKIYDWQRWDALSEDVEP